MKILFIFSLFYLLASLYVAPVILIEAKSTSSDDNIIFSKLEGNEVLSNNPVYSICQDKYGYMWLGGNGYLFKYDSSEIYEITTLGNNTFNIVWSVFMDSDQTLWIGTVNGLYCYDYETEVYTGLFNDNLNNTSISDNYIWSICEDRDNNLWIGTAHGLNMFDRENEVVNRFFSNPSDSNTISDNYVRCVYEDNQGILWLGTLNGLNKFDRGTGIFTRYFYDPEDPRSISNNRIRSIYEDSRGVLWIGTEDGLNVFDRETDAFTRYFYDSDNPYSISSSNVITIYEDSRGILWMGTRHGLNMFDRETGIFTRYFYDPTNYSSIGNSILVIREDEQGILWIGTREGVYYIDPDKQYFNYHNDNLIKNNEIRSIYNLEETLLLGGLNSVMNFIDSESNIEELINFKSITGEIGTAIVNCIAIDKERRIMWVGTNNLGLVRIDMETFKYTIYYHEALNPNSMPEGTIQSLYFNSTTDLLWIGTNNGLCSYDYQLGKFTRYNHNPGLSTTISSNIINVIYGNRNNELWLGTDKGLDRFEPGTEDFVHFFKDSQSPKVESIYEDSNYNLWIGTVSGLFKYNQQEENYTTYTINDGLPDNHIMGIIEDNYGDIWISTNSKIAKLSSYSNSISSYGVDHGLRGYISYRNSIAKNKEGAIFIGTTNGIFSFYPDKIETDIYIPPVLVKDFKLVNGNPISFDKPIEEVKEVTLNYIDNSFIIDCIALDYSSQYTNKYAYKLEGFDSDWHFSGPGTCITKYTNIPAGKYIFKAIACNKDGIWNKEGASLSIIIVPPFWQQWWFIILLISTGLLLIYTIIKVRTYVLMNYSKDLEYHVSNRTTELENKTEELETELKHRVEFTRALAHDLKSPLTSLIATSDLLISNKLNEPVCSYAKNIAKGANILNQRIEDLLDLARGEVNALSLQLHQVNLNILLNDIVKYEKPKMTMNHLSIDLKLENHLPLVYIDRKRIQQVILNLLDNAVKFTPNGGSITISAREKEKYIIISISDTGCGVPKKNRPLLFQPYVKLSKKNNKSGLGLGLSLCKMIVELHNGQIWLEDDLECGATFSFSIPIYLNRRNSNESISD